MATTWFDQSIVTGGGTTQTLAAHFTGIQTSLALKAPLASPTFTGVVTAPTFVGALTGNVTGDVTGNASTATTLQTARAINGVSFNGSAAITVTANTTFTLTRGTYLTGTDFNGSAATTWAVDATALNTASKVVARDGSGNFAAGTITAALTGNASTATLLSAGADRTKLDGIAAGATLNATDAALRDRTTHTGSQATSTITGLDAALALLAPKAAPTFTGAVAADKFVTTAGAVLTIAAGVVTATNGYHAIDTEAAAATDDLDTINGGSAGMTLILRAANDARDVVLKDATGNLRLNGDFTLTHSDDRIVLLHDGVAWAELSRNDATV